MLTVRITGAPPGSDLRTSVGPAVKTRSVFEETLRTGKPPYEIVTNVPTTKLDPIPLQPDGTKLVPVVVTSQALVDAPGVYPVELRVRNGDDVTLTRAVTHLIRVPAQPTANRLRAALLFRLGAPPALRPDGSTRIDRPALEELRTLSSEMAAHPTVPLTASPTPETLDALGSSTRNTDGELAAEIKAQLTSPGRQVIAPPYVPLDATAWLDAGLSDELVRQRDTGASVVAAALGSGDNRTFIGGPDLSSATLGRLRSLGVEQLVVPEVALAPLNQNRFPHRLTEPFKVPSDAGGPTPAVQIDDSLQRAFTRTSDPVLAAHQLLAELAVMATDQGRALGGAVLAPPPGWVPSHPFLRTLLNGLRPDNPFVEATTVDRIFVDVPPAGTNGSATERRTGPRGVDLVRPLTPRPAPSLGDFPERLRAARSLLTSYKSMVGDGSARPAPFDDKLRVAGSADLTTREWRRYLAAVDNGLRFELGGISTPAQEKITLTARNAVFPITLVSRLSYPVRVVVDLAAGNRLVFPAGNRLEVTLPAAQKQVHSVKVRAPVSGDTPLRITVRSADGGQVLAQSRYTVRSTAVSGVGIVLTVGAALFLLFWWTRHWRSSARTRRNPPPTA